MRALTFFSQLRRHDDDDFVTSSCKTKNVENRTRARTTRVQLSTHQNRTQAALFVEWVCAYSMSHFSFWPVYKNALNLCSLSQSKSMVYNKSQSILFAWYIHDDSCCVLLRDVRRRVFWQVSSDLSMRWILWKGTDQENNTVNFRITFYLIV